MTCKRNEFILFFWIKWYSRTKCLECLSINMLLNWERPKSKLVIWPRKKFKKQKFLFKKLSKGSVILSAWIRPMIQLKSKSTGINGGNKSKDVFIKQIFPRKQLNNKPEKIRDMFSSSKCHRISSYWTCPHNSYRRFSGKK